MPKNSSYDYSYFLVLTVTYVCTSIRELLSSPVIRPCDTFLSPRKSMESMIINNQSRIHTDLPIRKASIDTYSAVRQGNPYGPSGKHLNEMKGVSGAQRFFNFRNLSSRTRRGLWYSRVSFLLAGLLYICLLDFGGSTHVLSCSLPLRLIHALHGNISSLISYGASTPVFACCGSQTCCPHT